jgi:hypothetical protein
MFRVFANHPHHTVAMDNLALVANFLYRSTNLHFPLPQLVLRSNQRPDAIAIPAANYTSEKAFNRALRPFTANTQMPASRFMALRVARTFPLLIAVHNAPAVQVVWG